MVGVLPLASPVGVPPAKPGRAPPPPEVGGGAAVPSCASRARGPAPACGGRRAVAAPRVKGGGTDDRGGNGGLVGYWDARGLVGPARSAGRVTGLRAVRGAGRRARIDARDLP